MIDWVFFDVGNVLFNDDPQSFASYRGYHEELRKHDPDYDFAEMLAEREELARTGATWVLFKIAARRLPEARVAELLAELRGELDARYDDVHLLDEGVLELLTELRRSHRLGVIANQPPECRHSLRRRGLLDLFDMVAISEEVDLHKPDPELYRWALRASGATPEKSVMVGDRLDNDVAPARAVGMKAIWLRWPSSEKKSWRPTDPQAREFLRSCDRVPHFATASDSANEPDHTVSTLAEVPAALASLAGGTDSPSP